MGIQSSTSPYWRPRTKDRAFQDLLGWNRLWFCVQCKETEGCVQLGLMQPCAVNQSHAKCELDPTHPQSHVWGNRHSLTGECRHSLNSHEAAHPSPYALSETSREEARMSGNIWFLYESFLCLALQASFSASSWIPLSFFELAGSAGRKAMFHWMPSVKITPFITTADYKECL